MPTADTPHLHLTAEQQVLNGEAVDYIVDPAAGEAIVTVADDPAIQAARCFFAGHDLACAQVPNPAAPQGDGSIVPAPPLKPVKIVPLAPVAGRTLRQTDRG